MGVLNHTPSWLQRQTKIMAAVWNKLLKQPQKLKGRTSKHWKVGKPKAGWDHFCSQKCQAKMQLSPLARFSTPFCQSHTCKLTKCERQCLFMSLFFQWFPSFFILFFLLLLLFSAEINYMGTTAKVRGNASVERFNMVTEQKEEHSHH